MQRVLVSLLAVTVCFGAGCAHSVAANRFIAGSVPDYTLPSGGAQNLASPLPAGEGGRGQATPERPRAATIESTDASLARALALAALEPSAESHRRAGEEYLRVGITDLAADHFTAAVALDPGDAAAYDLRARLWRDWGFPAMGLGDAHRAAYFSPASAAAQNTLGTMLQALGRYPEARARYERTLTLDPSAAYAHNNLCALSLIEGDAAGAIASCRRALDLAPQMAAAVRNLERARAMLGKRPEGRGR